MRNTIPLLATVLAAAITVAQPPVQAEPPGPPGAAPSDATVPSSLTAPSSGPGSTAASTGDEWARDSTAALSAEIDELHALADRIDSTWKASLADFNTQSAQHAGKIDNLQKTITGLEGVIGELREELRRRTADPDPPRPPPGPIRLDDPTLWVVLALGLGGGAVLSALVRPRSTAANGSRLRRAEGVSDADGTRTVKRVNLPILGPSGDWPDFDAIAEGTWANLRIGAAWREEWIDLARKAMAEAWAAGSQPAGRLAAAEFAAGVWARFVSQFEPDRSSWAWTAATCSRALPRGMRVTLGTVRPNEPYANHAGVVTQASGEGQYIADVHFPGCVVGDTDGRPLHELGAVVVKGDHA